MFCEPALVPPAPIASSPIAICEPPLVAFIIAFFPIATEASNVMIGFEAGKSSTSTQSTYVGYYAGLTDMIADDAVTYTKMQDVANTGRILGRISSGSGVIEELTKANILSFISAEDGATNTAHPAIYDNSGTPALRSGITAAEVRTAIGAGTGSGSVSSLSDLSITATASEINYLDNDNLTAADLTKLAALTATAAEINYLDDDDLTAADLTKPCCDYCNGC